MQPQIEFNENDLFLPIDVYRDSYGKCGGITDVEDRIFIPCETGNYYFKNIENKDLIFIPEQRSPDYHALKPYTKQGKWTMYGGNLAYSCDSRCKHIYRIHDRIEE
jgi:hypothetical protein